MVASQQVNVVGVINFQHQYQRKHLNAEFAAVYVVSQEKILCAGNRPKFLEDSEKIIELTMDISYNN
jgi:hypothetical protein